MKNYKKCNKEWIGSSDKATLTINSEELKFGEDGDYYAYIIDENTEIGDHYKLTLEIKDKIIIYDDEKYVKEYKADIINIYRSGLRGCIIQLINFKKWELKVYNEKNILTNHELMTDSEMLKRNECLNSGRSSYNRKRYDYRLGREYSSLIVFRDYANGFKSSYRIKEL